MWKGSRPMKFQQGSYLLKSFECFLLVLFCLFVLCLGFLFGWFLKIHIWFSIYCNFFHFECQDKDRPPGFYFSYVFCAKALSVMDRQIYTASPNTLAVEHKYEYCTVHMSRMQMTLNAMNIDHADIVPHILLKSQTNGLNESFF